MVCVAATRVQARIAFDSMAAIIRADAELGERFEIVEHRHSISYAATGSTAKALSAESLRSSVSIRPWRSSTSCTCWAPRRRAANC